MLETLSTAQLAILGVLGAALLGACVVRLRAIRWIAAGMLFLSALGVAIDPNGDIPIRLWLAPLQADRSTIYLAMGVLGCAAGLIHVGRLRGSRVAGQSICLVVMGFYAGMMRILAGEPEDGLQSLLLAAITIVPLMLLLPSMLEEWEDVYALLRALALASLVWAGAVGVQFLIDWKKLVVQHMLLRFHGLTANPQHAGVYLAIVAVISLFLVLNDPKLRYRPLWVVATGANTVLLLWTGSRTGLGMGVLGATAVFYSSAGRAILFLPIVGVFVAIAFSFLQGSRIEFDIGGLSSGRGDTRRAVWAKLVSEILRHPVTGIGIPKDIPSENSLLYGTAAYGLGMGLLMVGLALLAGLQSLALVRRRSLLAPAHRRMVDLVLGFYAMYFGGSVFEGYIIARVSPTLIAMLVFASLGRRLVLVMRETPDAPAHLEPGALEPSTTSDAQGHPSAV